MSETAKRIISGVILGGVVSVTLYFYQWFAGIHAFALILAFSLLGVEEFYRLTDRGMDGRPVRGIGFLFTVLLLLVIYLDYLSGLSSRGDLPDSVRHILSVFQRIQNPVLPVLLLFVVAAASYSMIFRPLDGTAFTITTTIAGPLYAAVPLGLVFLIMGFPEGLFVFLYIALGTIMTDIGAYFAGRWFGKHNAGLKASPKKTYEGYVGGVVSANIVVQVFVYVWLQMHPGMGQLYVPGWIESIVLTFAISIISVLGDLVESALKRDARIKDSSSTIPGHGGVLDLMDAMLFTFPLGYYYFYLRALVLS